MTTQTEHTFEDAVARLQSRVGPAANAQIDAVYAFRFKDTGHTDTLDLRRDGGAGWLAGAPDAHGLVADFEVAITQGDFARLVYGELHPMAGMATGRMRLTGDFKQAIKLDRLLKS